jgi:uncharacterized protein (UPF0335 family)
MSMWSETIPVAEAAEKLLAFVREIRELDATHEYVNQRKAEIYREVKAAGFSKKATKMVAGEPSLEDDIKALRQYLTLLCGDEAAGLLKTEEDFGPILFGSGDGWPTDYVDPKHGLANTPED